ncbi:hypothetical protein [Thalassobacillus sp. CUG 92003]|uniref:hypothetical protein n=1 Tax=Thalassobacillus sp. CUG 92003 TaxID=2736641 RepID=UPI0015E70FCA|nr:hypothetical protein [Thalassobacillus sp. CUG 92003]
MRRNLLSWLFAAVGLMNLIASVVLLFVMSELIIGSVLLGSGVLFLVASRIDWNENHDGGDEDNDSPKAQNE